MSAPFQLAVLGIAAWAPGLPDWNRLAACARGESEPLAEAPRRPAPDMLPANERRRAPDSVLLALQVAQAACQAANRAPSSLPSVFTSTHGDLAITDYMCQTLATAPSEISPTKFHNSVHNAAAGYWTIGSGCHQPATAISAYRGSFAQGLLESALQIDEGAEAVLLVAYDSASVGPLSKVSCSEGLLGFALVLAAAGTARDASLPGVSLQYSNQPCSEPVDSRLQQAFGGNAMAPCLILADALAGRRQRCSLPAAAQQSLDLELHW